MADGGGGYQQRTPAQQRPAAGGPAGGGASRGGSGAPSWEAPKGGDLDDEIPF
jgi:hypothetical protein